MTSEEVAGRVRAYCGATSDWAAFAKSYDDLEPDTHMADGADYRKRRYAAFRSILTTGGLVRQRHRAHFQDIEHNPLNGGVDRWFAPITAQTAATCTLRSLLQTMREMSDALLPGRAWDIEVHQFRIEASEVASEPTPEGVHRDGVDFAYMVLVARKNVSGGESIIVDGRGEVAASFTMTEPGECLIVDDRRMRHGVSSLVADGQTGGYRDVLVVTFKGIDLLGTRPSF